MAKTVVLARPHPFLVSDMRPWLEGAGFGVSKPEKADDLISLARGCRAAVVSLALTSPTGMSVDDVLQVLKNEAPDARLLFASLLPFEKAKPAIVSLAVRLGMQPSVVHLGASKEANQSLLGRRDTWGYLAKDDLADSVLRMFASNLMLKHFA